MVQARPVGSGAPRVSVGDHLWVGILALPGRRFFQFRRLTALTFFIHSKILEDWLYVVFSAIHLLNVIISLEVVIVNDQTLYDSLSEKLKLSNGKVFIVICFVVAE